MTADPLFELLVITAVLCILAVPVSLAFLFGPHAAATLFVLGVVLGGAAAAVYACDALPLYDERLEEKYGFTIDEGPGWTQKISEPATWTIDGEQRTCYVQDFSKYAKDNTLMCEAVAGADADYQEWLHLPAARRGAG